MNIFLRLFNRKKESTVVERVEREVWYDLVKSMRAWDVNWQNYLNNTDPIKPMTQDEFIDKQIKIYKLRDREQKRT